MSDATDQDPPVPAVAPARAGRLLLRAARAGTLATSAGGQPFASLITPATAPDGSILMLLSGLSDHTRHLKQEPRCAVMVMGAPDGPNPQTAPRLTVSGLAAPEPDPALKARWVTLHPYAGFYAGLGDFVLWRVRPLAGHYIGGFASAHRLPEAALTPDPQAVAAVAASEGGILGHCNADHADALASIAVAHGGAEAAWRMVACDVDGFDLADNETVLRIPFATPVDGPGGVRKALVDLAGAARNRALSIAGRAGTAPV